MPQVRFTATAAVLLAVLVIPQSLPPVIVLVTAVRADRVIGVLVVYRHFFALLFAALIAAARVVRKKSPW